MFRNVQSNKEFYEIYNEYWNTMIPRRVIAMIIMIALIVFMWYYSVMFCGVFHHAQYGWFYSGLWCLFFDWFGFAPLFIFMFSAIEQSVEEENAGIYYIKALWLF